MKEVVVEEATILVEEHKKHGNINLIGFNGVDYQTLYIQILINDKPTRFKSISPR